jgi:hypothetical protein
MRVTLFPLPAHSQGGRHPCSFSLVEVDPQAGHAWYLIFLSFSAGPWPNLTIESLPCVRHQEMVLVSGMWKAEK